MGSVKGLGMKRLIGFDIVLKHLLPIDELIEPLSHDEGKILLSLLLYGTASALEEGLIPCELADQVILCNANILSYCEKNLKDAALTETMIDGIQASDYIYVMKADGLDEKTTQANLSEYCAEMKAKLIQDVPWEAD